MRKAVIGLVVTGIAVWWWTKPPFPPFPMEVTVELTVDGEKVTLNRVVSCEYDTFYQGIGSGPSYTIAPNPQAFGQEMPRGGAVIVATPAACDLSEHTNRNYRTGQKFRPIADGYVPLVLWMPDINQPGILHAHVSPEHLRSEKSRITFHGIKVEPATRRPDPKDNFTWLRSANDQEFVFGYATRFLVVADENEWSQFSPLAEILSTFSETKRIEFGPTTTPILFGYDKLHLDVDVNLGRMLAGAGVQPETRSARPNGEAFRSGSATSRIYPMIYEQGAFRPDMTRQGVVVLYRTTPQPVVPIINKTDAFGVQMVKGGIGFVMGQEIRNPFYIPNRHLVINITQAKLFLSPDAVGELE